MVYIAPDGSVHQTRPWSLGRIADIFRGAAGFIVQFFQTLFGFTNPAVTGGSSSRRGDGGNGPGGPGGRPPRRMGTMKEIQDCSMPGGG